jgi:hypothetical protein
LRVYWCEEPSLMRGRVCLLQLLLVLAESRGTHDHILLSQIRDSPRSSYLHPPARGWPSYTHRYWVGSLFVVSYDWQGYGGGIARTSQKTAYISMTTTKRLTLFREISGAYREHDKEQINALCGQMLKQVNAWRPLWPKASVNITPESKTASEWIKQTELHSDCYWRGISAYGLETRLSVWCYVTLYCCTLQTRA